MNQAPFCPAYVPARHPRCGIVKIGVPVLNRGDILLKLVRGIDVEARVLIIVNRIGPVEAGVAEAVAHLAEHPPSHLQIVIEQREGNLGVAGSWNRIIDYFGGECLIANSDIEFTSGVLARAMEEIAAQPHLVLQHLYAAACFYVAPEFTSVLGWFDENFYPAYCEDQEMSMRSRSLEVRRCSLKGLGKASILHGVSSTVRSAGRGQKAFIHKAKSLNRLYLHARWGPAPPGSRHGERYRRPFDDPDQHPAQWTLDFERRELMAKSCQALTGYPCPLEFHRSEGGLDGAGDASFVRILPRIPRVPV